MSIVSIQEIETRYVRWNDPLSYRLHRWSSSLLAIGTVTAEAMAALKSLLMNPLSPGTLFVNPWMENRVWIWEKSLYDRWPDSSSPFHPQKKEKGEEHSYAKAMLQWAKFEVQRENSSTTVAVVGRISDRELNHYILLGQIAAQMELGKLLADDFEARSDFSRELLAKKEERGLVPMKSMPDLRPLDVDYIQAKKSEVECDELIALRAKELEVKKKLAASLSTVAKNEEENRALEEERNRLKAMLGK